MKNRMLISLLVIAMAAALIGGATMAWFTDAAETEVVDFQAGTLLVDVDNFEVDLGETLSLDRLNPGDCWTYEFDVVNEGTKSANWLLYLCWQDVIGQENEDLEADMRAILADKEYGDTGLSEVLTWNIDVDGNEVFSGLLDGAPVVMDQMDAFGVPGEDAATPKHVTVTVCLPEDADNAYQGGAMKIAFGVKAWQTTNEAPAPEVTAEDCPFDVDEEDPNQPDPPADPELKCFEVNNVNTGDKSNQRVLVTADFRAVAVGDDENTFDFNGTKPVTIKVDGKKWIEGTPGGWGWPSTPGHWEYKTYTEIVDVQFTNGVGSLSESVYIDSYTPTGTTVTICPACEAS